MNAKGKTMRNIRRLLQVVVCGLVLALTPVMAESTPPASGNSHELIWDSWQPLAGGYMARRRVPARLELPVEARRAPATQSRAQADTFNKASSELSLWLYTGVPGMYSVGLDEVAAETGISVKSLQVAAKSRRLGLTNAGRDVPYYYDSAYQRLLFAGEAYTTFYTDENAYRLVTSQKPHPRLISTVNARPAELPPGQSQPFREVLQFVEETDMMYSTWLYPGDPDARYWFWDYLYGSSRPQIQLSVHVPNPAPDGTARLRVKLHGFTNQYPGDEHRVYAKLNGVPVGSELVWDGLAPAELVAEFNPSLLHADGDNTLTLHTVYDTAHPWPGQFLESVAVEYDRLPVATDGQIWLRDVTQGLQEVTGFSSPDILVVESPVQNAILRSDAYIHMSEDGTWAVTLNTRSGKDYLIAEAPAFLGAAFDARPQADLNALRPGADVLIIAPREFSGTAQDLAELRRAGHAEAAVVWLDDIYKSFSAGRVDPYAIGQFMDWVRTQWSRVPAAVTLIGKGSLDRKDCMGYGDNFLPVLMTSTPWALAASDSRLLGIDDGATPMAVGRIAITNDGEGRAYVNKLRAHASRDNTQAAERALVVADNPDSGGAFHQDGDLLAVRLQDLGVWWVETLYHPTDPVRATLIQSAVWESGLISFSGHGSVAQLGTNAEKFLRTSDAAALRNGSCPVFLALTCAAGDDSLPGVRSLSSTLVLNPQGGAVASLAASGLSFNSDAHVLAHAFIQHLYGSHINVGEALVGAKQDTAGQIAVFMAPLYSIIGDPSVYPW